MTERPRAGKAARRRPSPGSPPVASHTNRFGNTYYLHASQTKTGKPRYLVRRSIGDGALSAMPDGFEFAESVNGVVSVRRVDPSRKTVPAEDVELVAAELRRHDHLRQHVVDVRKTAILICEPIESLASFLGKPSRVTPVMRFECLRPGTNRYAVSRMSYRGAGGWYELSMGDLSDLVRRYVRHIGTERFFELL